MAQRRSRGYQDGFIESVEEQLRICEDELRALDGAIELKQAELADLRGERADAVERIEQLRACSAMRDPERNLHPF